MQLSRQHHENYCVAVCSGDTTRPNLFVNLVQNNYPWIHLLLLHDCCPDVLQEFSQNSYTLMLPTNLGVVSKEPLVKNELFENQFFVGHSPLTSFTVTFASYTSLYSLDNDMGMLQSVPRYGHHLFALQLARNINWRQMVVKCARGLHIQFPKYHSSHCSIAPTILCLGWQTCKPVRDNVMTIGALFQPLVSSPVYIYNTQRLPQKFGHLMPRRQRKRLPMPKLLVYDRFNSGSGSGGSGGNSGVTSCDCSTTCIGFEEKKETPTRTFTTLPTISTSTITVPTSPCTTASSALSDFDDEDDWVLHAEL